jgi:hypothetical protein
VLDVEGRQQHKALDDLEDICNHEHNSLYNPLEEDALVNLVDDRPEALVALYS